MAGPFLIIKLGFTRIFFFIQRRFSQKHILLSKIVKLSIMQLNLSG